MSGRSQSTASFGSLGFRTEKGGPTVWETSCKALVVLKAFAGVTTFFGAFGFRGLGFSRLEVDTWNSPPVFVGTCSCQTTLSCQLSVLIRIFRV